MQSVCFTLRCQIDLTKESLPGFAHDITHWSVRRGSSTPPPRGCCRQMAKQLGGSSTAPEHPDVQGSWGKTPRPPPAGSTLALPWKPSACFLPCRDGVVFFKCVVLLRKSRLGALIIQMVNASKRYEAQGCSPRAQTWHCACLGWVWQWQTSQPCCNTARLCL